MAYMVSYARICPDNSKYVQFNPLNLHPIDGLKVLLEQQIFADYLLYTSRTVAADSILQKNREFFNCLPSRINEGDYGPAANLYAEGLELYNRGVVESITNGVGPAVARTLYNIFSLDSGAKYINGEYVSSINSTFLTEYLAWRFGIVVDPNKQGDTELHYSELYVPRTELVLNRDPAKNRHDNDNWLTVINLEPHKCDGFKLVTINQDSYPTLFGLIGRLNLNSLHVDDLIPILAGFSLDHVRYGMTDLPNNAGFGVEDVCFDLVTERCYSNSAGLSYVSGLTEFINMLKKMYVEQRIQGVEDLALFGELLARCGETADLVNYFTKPIAEITASEALSFRKSVYADLVADRFYSGMEAVDDIGSTTDDNGQDASGAGDTQSDTQPADQNEGADKTEAPAEDANATDQPGEDKEEMKKGKELHRPTIDPEKMLLEMASTSETLSDYIFRETVSKRIDNVLKNPPENARPNDLMMLKRWRSSWLWLTSISCLRDFLTRLSLRLSNP